jgi:hypothetical protein
MDIKELKRIVSKEEIKEGDAILLEIEHQRALPIGPMIFVSLNKLYLKFKGMKEGGSPFTPGYTTMKQHLDTWTILDLSKITRFGEKVE